MGSLLIAATIVVSAASSLTDVLAAIAKRYESAAGERVQINAGASNTLARQIIEGAPVDLFISADNAQMDAVENHGAVVPGSRVPLLGNRLVVIVPRISRVRVDRPEDLAASQVRRLAIANPAVVPAGVYARKWLEGLGLWPTVTGKVVPLPTVRAALAAVREGRADAGIVYATDARSDEGVSVAFTPQEAQAGAIVYPAALIKGPRTAAAARFLKYLRSPEAAELFRAAGFTLAPQF